MLLQSKCFVCDDEKYFETFVELSFAEFERYHAAGVFEKDIYATGVWMPCVHVVICLKANTNEKDYQKCRLTF